MSLLPVIVRWWYTYTYRIRIAGQTLCGAVARLKSSTILLTAATQQITRKKGCTHIVVVAASRRARISMQPARSHERWAIVSPMVYDRRHRAPTATNIVPVSPQIAAVCNHCVKRFFSLVVAERCRPRARVRHVATTVANRLSHCSISPGKQGGRSISLIDIARL